MAVKPHAFAGQPVKIRRVALRDEVGPQPVPYHQHHDTAAAAMRIKMVLRPARRGCKRGYRDYKEEKNRENFGRA